MKGRKQIREIGPCGAPFGVIRVHGVAGEGTEMRLASRTTPRHRIYDGNLSSCVDLPDVRSVSISWDYAAPPKAWRILACQVGWRECPRSALMECQPIWQAKLCRDIALSAES